MRLILLCFLAFKFPVRVVEDIPVSAAFVPHFPIITGAYAEPPTFSVGLALTLVRRWLFVR